MLATDFLDFSDRNGRSLITAIFVVRTKPFMSDLVWFGSNEKKQYKSNKPSIFVRFGSKTTQKPDRTGPLTPLVARVLERVLGLDWMEC